MPELPEVETVKLFLESKLIGTTITSLKILTPKSFLGNPDQVINKKITSFFRHGKQLTINLSGGLSLLIHLKMTGQLMYVPLASSREGSGVSFAFGHPTKDIYTQNLPNKSTRVTITFSNQSLLYFNDQRKFGWIKIVNTKDLPHHHRNFGLDILDPKFTAAYFYSQLQNTSRPIKVVLLDQSKSAGIGNIYANDSLFDAKINPTTPTNQISRPAATRLHRAIIKIIQESIAHGGSTARDNLYLRPDGTTGSQQYHFRVYQREGEKCQSCNSTIKRIVIAGRSTFFCNKCQKP